MSSLSALETALKKEFPEATDEEVSRFADSAVVIYGKSKKKNKDILIEEAAKNRLEGYLDWRNCYGLEYAEKNTVPLSNGGTSDADIWNWAVGKAVNGEHAQEEARVKLQAAKIERKGSKDSEDSVKVDYDAQIDSVCQEDNTLDKGNDKDKMENTADASGSQQSEACKNSGTAKAHLLPQIIFKRLDPNTGDVIRDKNGVPVLHVLAARLDRLAASADVWALAISLYLERQFERSRSSQEDTEGNKDAKNSDASGIDSFTLLVDTRGGANWPNPKFIMMITLIRKVVNTVSMYHPGRIRSLVIFPLPRALLGVWNSVKGVFGPDVVGSLHLISGPSKPGSPLPKEELEEFVDGGILDLAEKCREELDAEGKL